jgi:site-specific recombinase XerD
MSNPIVIDQSPELPESSLIPSRDSAVTLPGVDYRRLRELFGPYRRYLEFERDYPPSSVNTYAKEGKRFISWLEENPEPISRGTFLRYREFLKGRYAPSTVNLALVGVRKFLAWLYDNQMIPENPALGLEGVRQRGRGKGHKRDALTPSEARRLLESIPTGSAVGARDKAIIGAMLFGGLRTIEIRRVTMGHYRTRGNRRVLLLQGKGRSEADDLIVIVPELEAILAGWLAVHPNGGNAQAPIFCSLSKRSFGEPLSSSSIRRMIKARFKAAGIRDDSKSTHSLRHSAITAVILGGGTLLQAQRFARHDSPETTQVYIHEIDRLENPPELLISY